MPVPSCAAWTRLTSRRSPRLRARERRLMLIGTTASNATEALATTAGRLHRNRGADNCDERRLVVHADERCELAATTGSCHSKAQGHRLHACACGRNPREAALARGRRGVHGLGAAANLGTPVIKHHVRGNGAG